MIVRKAFKFRLRVKPHQEEKLSQFAGCCRFVWNRGLALNKESNDQDQGYLNYHSLATQLPAWKKSEEMAFLKESQSQILQQSLKDLDRAFKDFFKKTKGFPKFRKRGVHDSFRFPQGVKVEGSRVFLPKLGKYKFFKSREMEGEVKNTTVSRVAGKWFVSFQVEKETSIPVHPSNSDVGVDLGVSKLAALSNGDFFRPLNPFRSFEKKLAKLQKNLSRKKKFSENWKKQKKEVQSIHSKIANIRKDHLHKITSAISQKHAFVAMEDLKTSNMSRSAKGTLEDPGKNVKAKSGLNKSILDQGWHEFKRQMEYKLGWLGGKLQLVPAHYTSQKCSQCGHTEKENRKTQSRFECVECGNKKNADTNAAINILEAGHAFLACGDIRSISA